MKTLVLAHYYTTPEVQQLADYVGDSLELSLRARESKAERIVFAGVRFMAETAKILNPQTEVIIPDIKATCSLVTQAEETHNHGNAILTLEELIPYVKDDGFTVVTYINSSYQVKAFSDVIVTSANVEQIVTDLINDGHMVYFTPDRNMGAYLKWSNPQWGNMFQYYQEAVCEVHDKFKEEEITKAMMGWANYGRVLLAHPESPLPVLRKADLVGSTSKMLKYVSNISGSPIVFVATEEGLLYNMRKARPDLDIRLAPTYSGCQCNACPYMRKNTVESVQNAINGSAGAAIDYIPEDIRLQALKPIQRMLEWNNG